jgi:hypothetical protein
VATFNVATGQLEDDEVDTGVPPLLQPPVTPPASAPPPVALPPIATPSPTPPPVTPPIVPAKSTPTLPGMGLPVSSQTVNAATVSGKITSPQMLASDKEVADAVEQGRQANDKDAANALKQAEIDQHDLDIKIQERRLQGQQAKERADEAARARAALEKRVNEDDQKYRDAAAADPKGFWGKDGDEVETRKSWALSLMFGNIAETLLGDPNANVGARLLNKTMTEWKQNREANLAQLEKRALASSGLLQTFWREHGAEAKAQKEIQDGAAYDLFADDIEANAVRNRGLIEDKVIAANLQVAAKYRQNAADARSKALELRAKTLTTGGGSTTYAAAKPGEAGAGDELMVQDSAGNTYQAVSEDDAKKARASKGRLDQAIHKIDDVIGQARTNGPGWFGKVKSIGQPGRELEGQMASLATALSEAQGDTSERNVKAIKARFAPDRFTNQEEFIGDLTRVRDEQIKTHDAAVGAATGKKVGGGKAAGGSSALPPGATPGEYHGKKGYRIGKDFYVQE